MSHTVNLEANVTIEHDPLGWWISYDGRTISAHWQHGSSDVTVRNYRVTVALPAVGETAQALAWTEAGARRKALRMARRLKENYRKSHITYTI